MIKHLKKLNIRKTIMVALILIGAAIWIAASFIDSDDTTVQNSTQENTTSDRTETTDTASQNTIQTFAGCGENVGISTANAVRSAGWTDNVTITVDDVYNEFRFESNGMPEYGLADYYLIPNEVGNQPFADLGEDEFTKTSSADLLETDVDTTITTLPQCVTETVDTSLGRIGVVLNGAQLFNDYENMERSVVALDDNVTHDHASFVDDCNGHPLQGLDGYHYHGVPTCITEKVDTAGQHSVMIGVLEDGFPVYGPQDESGEIITSAQLDECSGHFGPTPEFPSGIYHYHLTQDVAPYSVDCYHGEVDAAAQDTGPMGPPPR